MKNSYRHSPPTRPFASRDIIISGFGVPIHIVYTHIPTCTAITFTRVRVREHTHTLVYIFYVHIQSTARGDMRWMSEGRVEQETIDWCRPVRPLPRTTQPSSRCGAEKGALWLMAVKRAFPGKYYYTASTDTLHYYYYYNTTTTTVTITIVPWYWLSFHSHMFHKVRTLSTVHRETIRKNISSFVIYNMYYVYVNGHIYIYVYR